MPIALLAVVSTVVGRALAPALPGSLTGISGWIRAVDLLDAFLAQLFAVSSLLLMGRLVGNIVRADKVDLIFKLACLPISALVGFVVITKIRLDYPEPTSSLALALASGSLALAAAPALLRSAETRAVGLALGLSGMQSLLHATGRAVAVQATVNMLPNRFVLARAIESAAFVLGVVVVAITATWVLAGKRQGLFKLAAALVLVGWLSHAATRGSSPMASLSEVLTSRSLGYLLRDPAPFLPLFVRSAEAMLRFTLAFMVVSSRRSAVARVIFCLCLVSVSATDIPLLALSLTLAALLSHGATFERARRGLPAPGKVS